MPNNPESISNPESPNSENMKLGAKVLAIEGFHGHFAKPAENAFQRARKHGEKLPGNNAERRTFSYISRLQDLVDRRGNRLEKRLWDKSVDQLIISPENIIDDYWHTQEQILRDNGQGRTLSDYEKEILVQNIQESQRESLKSWSDYLGSEESPYPIWFKLYAWDGVSKMSSVFNKDKQQFARRDKHTVSPYPKLNPAVLAKVHGVIADFYDQSEQSRYAENSERDAELEALVRSGNFNKLYSKILLKEKAIPKTPERTEDIQGEWVEYLPGEEEKLAEAAEGTPWCVANPGTGRNYLSYGNYDGYDKYDDYDHDNSHEYQAKFILFHLRDPETNMLSSSACASIRLAPDGQVAEISGLNDDQSLEDSLVPIVEEKVRFLPGGEQFLEAFEDKKRLIALDRKMQNHENLTKEELEFLYEIHRPIKSLDTYNYIDPRLPELKNAYDINYALDQGLDANQFLLKMPSWDIVDNLDVLISHGANIDIDQLASKMNPYAIADNLDTLISHGANIDTDQLASELGPRIAVRYLDTLLSHGANIDIYQLASKMTLYDIADNLDALMSHGVNIDVNRLVSEIGLRNTVDNLDAFISHGADIDINQLVFELGPLPIANNLDTLLSHGADINQLVPKMHPDDIADNLDTLLSHGADINWLVSKIKYPWVIANNLDAFLSHGADINQIMARMDQWDIDRNRDILLRYGANI